MGCYYKLVNMEKKQRIEPGRLGDEGVKAYAMIYGPTAKLMAWLQIYDHHAWRLYADESSDETYHECRDRGHPNYCADMTEHYVMQWNEGREPEQQIAYRAPERHGEEP